MKKKIIISIIIITIICSLLFYSKQSGFMWNSCTNLTSESEEGISEGFRYERVSQFFNAVKSEKNQFNIDDVTLDFYIGSTDFVSKNDYDIIIPCLITYRHMGDFFSSLGECDYKELEGVYLIDEKNPEEFNKGPYDIELKWGYNYYFHFKNTWTIPKEAFKEEDGRFWYIVLVAKKENPQSEKYKLYGEGLSIIIEYTKIDENTISLSADTI